MTSLSPCCKDFDMDISPMEFSFIRKALSNNISLRGIEANSANKYTIEFILTNLVFLRADHQRASTRRKSFKVKYHYTCKKLDKETGKCTCYNNRPVFCHDYPDIGICSYKGCSSKHCKFNLPVTY